LTAARPPSSAASLAGTIFATWFGAGFAPVASGTVATAAAIPLQLAVALLPPPGFRMWAQIAAIAVTSIFGAIAAGALEKRLGREDPSEAVIDEVAGYLVTMFLVPVGVVTVVAGFVLFRIFDIVKPWPAGPAERLGGGIGIMADDLVCGVYACLILHGGVWLFEAVAR